MCYGTKPRPSIFYYSLHPSCDWFTVDFYSCCFFLHRCLLIYNTVVRYHFLDLINLLSHSTHAYLLRQWLIASFPLITHPSTTFHHVPESGLCTYLCSTNTAPFCNSNSKLGLLVYCLQSSFLVQRSLSLSIRRKPHRHKSFDYKDLSKLGNCQYDGLSLSLIPTSSTDWEDVGLFVSITHQRSIVGIGVIS